MTNRVLMTESVKKAVKKELNLDVENMTEEELLAELRASKKFVVTLKENGTFKVRQVLNG